MSYIVKDGTSYHVDTDPKVIDWLETSRTRRQPIRVFYGDTATGRSWDEENNVWGVVGRSMGRVKVPLLVHPNAHGAPAMLEHCIVAIVTKGSDGVARFVYRHPQLDLGTWTINKVERGYAIYHRGRFTTKRIVGGHLALVRDLRTGRTFTLSDVWLLDAKEA